MGGDTIAMNSETAFCSLSDFGELRLGWGRGKGKGKGGVFSILIFIALTELEVGAHTTDCDGSVSSVSCNMDRNETIMI